ncbi:SDR family NAD(P)-dependent oxidoreductase [Mesorhizobium sp. CO1-1-8]|uniref:SDR family NAD(P)-dependent oxidoreductase n=1 Tax=Mesorhizobium sp. CO1-1-8 TaxID=2876631 RepID=UPI001CD0AA93|nr:glucose 1-dehydrogenase [Mesorhizobium sp. CO1-1-8]MBZ9772564.1 glucose 1-dehydrogenase [Mesorhizobium sp. CO1-1-8]
MRLKGKRAIVTGSAGGIGAAIASAYAAEGCSVAIADLSLSRAEQMAAELRDTGARAIAIEVEVSDSKSVAEMVKKSVAEFGGLDVLVNNAGIMLAEDSGPEETSEEAWDKTILVNLKSIFLTCKYAIKELEKDGGGSIINIASIVGMLGSFPSQVAYTASKGGVISLSRELGVALARRGIRVNAICPGVTLTPLAAKMLEQKEAYELRRLHIPMGRMADPKEIAGVATFLASNDSSYVTSQAIAVDGGMVSAYLTPPD